MWNLDQSAKRYGKRPSELVNVSHKILAFMFDEAVSWLGRWVDAMLSRKDEKGNPLYTLDKLLGERNYAKAKRKGR